jgi:hypothetical protein
MEEEPIEKFDVRIMIRVEDYIIQEEYEKMLMLMLLSIVRRRAMIRLRWMYRREVVGSRTSFARRVRLCRA